MLCILKFRKHSFHLKVNEPEIWLLDFQEEIPAVVYSIAGLYKNLAVHSYAVINQSVTTELHSN